MTRLKGEVLWEARRRKIDTRFVERLRSIPAYADWTDVWLLRLQITKAIDAESAEPTARLVIN